MLISNIFQDYDLRLLYENAPLINVESHKHLGIHLSSNNKWTKDIDSIIDSASKQVSKFWCLKFFVLLALVCVFMFLVKLR